MTDLKTRSAITLKGSAKMIQEFFFFGINSILYQRGVYPEDTFRKEKYYGMNLLVTTNEKLKQFLDPLLQKVEELLTIKRLKRLVLVVIELGTKDILERWQFDVCTDIEADENTAKNVDEVKIKQNMADVLRQITAAVTFLPLLETDCAFDVLIYTHKCVELDTNWADSTGCHIDNAEEVQLRSFSTKMHDVKAKVQYRADL